MTKTTTAPEAGVSAAPRPRAGRRGRRQGGAAVTLAFVAPALIALVLFRVAPVIQAGLDSVRRRSLLSGGDVRFVGLENFADLFGSPEFRSSITTTFTFLLVVVPFQTVMALALAVLFTQRVPGTRVWRALMVLPVAVPMAVSSVIWSIALRPDGPVNAVLQAVGLPAQPFFTSSSQALFTLVMVVSWVGVGYWMVFFITGLQEIPVAYSEAAMIDGAGWWRTFFSITLPSLRRTVAFVVVGNTVANLTLFAPVQILTQGGPQRSTNLIMFDIFERAYILGDPYLASAAVVVLLVVTIAIVTVQFRLLSAKED